MFRWAKKLVLLALFVTVVTPSVVHAAPGPNAVVSACIAEADGTTGQNSNTGKGINTPHIQDAAVTPDKISFVGRVIIVAPSGGDTNDPSVAMAMITDASATNPYLVKLMPGVYNPAAEVNVKPYVDIEYRGRATPRSSGDSTDPVVCFS